MRYRSMTARADYRLSHILHGDVQEPGYAFCQLNLAGRPQMIKTHHRNSTGSFFTPPATVGGHLAQGLHLAEIFCTDCHHYKNGIDVSGLPPETPIPESAYAIAAQLADRRTCFRAAMCMSTTD